MDHPDDPQMRVCAETIYQSLFIQALGSLKGELTVPLRTKRRGRCLGPVAGRGTPREAGRDELDA